jgi:hypothetical protein
MRWQLALAFVLAVPAAGAQNVGLEASPAQSKPAAVILRADSRVLLGVPALASIGSRLCDRNGIFYVNVGNVPGQFGPFLGLSPDGKRQAVYSLPYKVRGWGSIHWAVTPGGRFYLLHGNESSDDFELVEFKDDGDERRTARLEIPPGTRVQHLAITESGIAYVSGYRMTADKDGIPRPAFAGLFAESGRLLRDLSTGAGPVTPDSSKMLEGDATAGEDGHFYILGPDKVTVLTQGGEMAGMFSFFKPKDGSWASSLYYSQGEISIGLDKIEKDEQGYDWVRPKELILDAVTGEERGFYAFDDALTGNVLCFDRKKGYSMYAIQDNQAAVDVIPVP